MKKYIVCTLLILVLLMSVIHGASYKVTGHEQKINVDGSAEQTPCYIFEQENYIKLRDLAALLQHTSGKIGLDYSVDKKEIYILPGKDYTPLSTDLMSLKKEASAEQKSTWNLYINQEQIKAKALLVDGHHFYRLRDLAEKLHLKISYDKDLHTVFIETSKEVPDLPEDEKEVRELSFEVTSMENIYDSTGERIDYEVRDGKLYVTFVRYFPTAGYSMEVEKVFFQKGNIKILTKVHGPGSNVVAQVITFIQGELVIDLHDLPFHGTVEIPGINPKVTDR
ncbi:MAG: hypothetical protein Q4Q17_04590 [Tissierellia bacterium]|nr:hypothetical protein [Tissierellia bacterium]